MIILIIYPVKNYTSIGMELVKNEGIIHNTTLLKLIEDKKHSNHKKI